MKLSVIVPMLNEASAIAAALDAIRAHAPAAEIIVVDGGSDDGSVEIARPRCDLLIESSRGRASQMNLGAAAASGDAFVFVHADTIMPPRFAGDVQEALRDPRFVGGRFDLQFDATAPAYRALGALISLRSRLMHATATGDQAIFVRREIFERIGGFPEIELCENVALARQLKRAGRVACLKSRVTTSARRWRKDGLIRTVLRMWTIKSLFLAGVPPEWLKRHYADTR